mgnify:CR=1 FL=1
MSTPFVENKLTDRFTAIRNQNSEFKLANSSSDKLGNITEDQRKSSMASKMLLLVEASKKRVT